MLETLPSKLPAVTIVVDKSDEHALKVAHHLLCPNVGTRRTRRFTKIESECNISREVYQGEILHHPPQDKHDYFSTPLVICTVDVTLIIADEPETVANFDWRIVSSVRGSGKRFATTFHLEGSRAYHRLVIYRVIDRHRPNQYISAAHHLAAELTSIEQMCPRFSHSFV